MIAVLLSTWMLSPAAAEPPREIPLYSGAAPGSEKWDWSERAVTNQTGMPMIQDVVCPVLLHYSADRIKAVGTAMIIAPGGGFRTLMMSYEGVDIAHRLNAMGVDAFVLKYRLLYSGPGAPTNAPNASSGPGERPKRFTLTGAYKAQAGQDLVALAADDGRQAVRLVRERAAEFGVRPERIGMIGFSAGGIVTTAALFGPAETRPDFATIIYGAGEIKDVPDPAPPLFLAVAADDASFVSRTIDLFTAYRKGNGRAELHVFQMGGHGFGKKGGAADHFMDRLEEWLAVNKLLSRAQTTNNVIGTWILSYDPGNGQHEGILTVAQEDSGLKGEFRDDNSKLEVTKIEFKDGMLSFATRSQRDGESATATWKGKIRDNVLEGEAGWESQGGSGTFRFGAKRQPDKLGIDAASKK
jgi:acetyl esterase/lipase